MFRGNHPTRVDEKGRLKVPAEFKRVIDEKYGQQFYITSFDGKVAQVYPFEEWERIEQKLQSDEEEVSRPHELLGPASRDGRSRPAADAATAARVRADQGRSGGDRKLDVLSGSKPGAVSPGDRGRQVHA